MARSPRELLKGKLSRREFLAIFAASAGAVALASCAQPAAPAATTAPAATKAPAAEPTATTAAAAAATPTAAAAAETPAAEAPTPTTAAEPTQQPAAAASTGPADTVRIGMSQEPDSLWPPASDMYAATVVHNLLYDALVGVNDKMQAFPMLAEEIPTLENGGAKWIGDGADKQLEVTFKLRKGVTWSDGQPLTADDVVFTWQLFMNPKSGVAVDLEKKWAKVEAKDANTVVFTMHSENSAKASGIEDFKDQKGPVIDPNYLFGLYAETCIFPKHVLGPIVGDDPVKSDKVEGLKDSDYARNPIGTGPYVLKDWTAGTSMTLEARDTYYRGNPKIKNVVFTFVPKSDTLIAQLKAGEIDVITQDAIDVKDSPVLDAIETAQAFYITGTTWEHIDCNCENEILKDKAVRQALMYGIDRQELIDKVFLGKTEPVNSAILSWSWAYNPKAPVYAYDPAKAEQLLEQAGWVKGADGIREKDGKKLALKYGSTDSPMRMKCSPLLKDQLAKIGVDLTIEHMPGKVWFAQEGPLTQGTYELGQYAWVGGYDPGADNKYSYHSINIPTKENGYQGGNYPRWSNKESDKLLDAGLATLDKAERTKIYQDWQVIFNTELPTLPLFARPNTTAASKRLKNIKPGMSSIGETWNIHEWELS